MKAILQYGQFTALMELPDIRPTIQIIKPQDALSFLPLDGAALAVAEVDEKQRLEFRYDQRLSDTFVLYRFEREL